MAVKTEPLLELMEVKMKKAKHTLVYIMQTSMFGFGHSRRRTGAESTADRMAR